MPNYYRDLVRSLAGVAVEHSNAAPDKVDDWEQVIKLAREAASDDQLGLLRTATRLVLGTQRAPCDHSKRHTIGSEEYRVGRGVDDWGLSAYKLQVLGHIELVWGGDGRWAIAPPVISILIDPAATRFWSAEGLGG